MFAARRKPHADLLLGFDFFDFSACTIDAAFQNTLLISRKTAPARYEPGLWYLLGWSAISTVFPVHPSTPANNPSWCCETSPGVSGFP